MPKVNFLHFPHRPELKKCPFHWTEHRLLELGTYVRPLFLDACQIDGPSPLLLRQIDWVPQPYVPGTIVDVPISFELETFGFEERVKKLTRDEGFVLKAKILRHELLHWFNPNDDLLWLRYQNELGWHV